MLTDPFSLTAQTLPQVANPIQWEEFGESPATTPIGRPIAKAIRRGTLDLRIELGRARIDCNEARRLRTGAIVPLENSAYDPVAIYADGKLIARGEILEVEGKYGVRVVEIIS